MPPFVQLTADGTTSTSGPVRTRRRPPTSSTWPATSPELAAPAPTAGSAPAGPAPAASGQPAAEGQPESVAAVLFTDYFTFILRQLVQDALDLYREYPYQAAPGDTLAGIAVRFGIGDPDQPDAAVSRDRGGQQELVGVLRDRRPTAGHQPAQHAGRRRRGDAARARRPAAAHAAAGRAGDPPGHRGARRRQHDPGGRRQLRRPATATRSPRSRPGWPPRSTRWPSAAAAVPGLLMALTTLTLPGGSYVVRPPDTLASIAAATGATLAQVAAAAADVPGLLYAGVGFALPPCRGRSPPPTGLRRASTRSRTGSAPRWPPWWPAPTPARCCCGRRAGDVRADHADPARGDPGRAGPAVRHRPRRPGDGARRPGRAARPRARRSPSRRPGQLRHQARRHARVDRGGLRHQRRGDHHGQPGGQLPARAALLVARPRRLAAPAGDGDLACRWACASTCRSR